MWKQKGKRSEKTKLPGKQEEEGRIDIQIKTKYNRSDHNRKRTRNKEKAYLKT